MKTQPGKNWSVPDVFVVFFPGQLLSEHRVFSQREAAVQVSKVQGLPWTGWFLNGHLHSFMIGWKNLKLLFDMTKPHTLGPVSQLWTFVSLKGWTWRPSSCSFFFFSPACSLKIPFLCYCFKACFSQHTSSLHTSLSTHIIGIYIFSSVDFSTAKAHFEFSVHWNCTLVISPQTK